MHPMLNIAIQAIRRAGNFVVKQYELFDKNSVQSNHINNLISKINKESYYIITAIIRKFYPLHTVINTWNARDINDVSCKESVFWIIGAIDNDINFIKQFPFFALSISVFIKGHIEIGVIYDPIHNELFSACRGKGAHLNGYRIRVGTAKSLHRAIIAISCSYEQQHMTINLLSKFSNKCAYFRYTGSTILDLAYVAVGRVDGCVSIFFKKNNYTNKLASGFLIIRESGGLIIDFTGTDNYLLSGNIIAGNVRIIRTILSIIQII
ncbi:inositol monophosphatase family protein [Blochmannia endosymbiont of Camponotus modoc]|uniref:inositol monophosphatase family protein n=1 Tax=Blochmannia endosymbiont of Camponotus modoc TaxID=2945587 RepID=UPI002024AF4E|nr:inositol monophosphatase family protein [Blochmannia endosymbiont of Camponotus modoc]URJ26269.1 inositol monophosphatase [Blochmannia endosymbiont of Camponotus modoc]